MNLLQPKNKKWVNNNLWKKLSRLKNSNIKKKYKRSKLLKFSQKLKLLNLNNNKKKLPLNKKCLNLQLRKSVPKSNFNPTLKKNSKRVVY